jgi:ketosteroid isomerase-like protein
MDKTAVVREFYAALAGSDLQAALSHLSDDVVWRGPSVLVSAGRIYRGLDEVRQEWAREFTEAYPEYWARPVEYVEGADVVIALGDHGARMIGLDGSMPMAQVWRFRGASIAEVQFFTDTAGLLLALSVGNQPLNADREHGD